jgi:cytochrome o ubiquinol oxidase subunit II
MIYTMNGMVTRLELRADQVGNYQGLSSHFSGDGFPDMLFDVHVLPQLQFSEWTASTARSDQVMDEANYTKLARQSIEKNATNYRLDDPELFDKITSQRIPPGPGPQLTADSAKPESTAAELAKPGSGANDAR